MRKPLSKTQSMLNIWAIVLIMWSVYRAKFQLPEVIDELIAKPIVFLLPVYWYIKNTEKKDFGPSVWLTTTKLFSNIYLSLFIGAIFALSALMANYGKFGTFSFGETLLNMHAQSLVFAIVIALFTAFCEEVVSRGFVLKRLYEESGNVYTSSFLASVLFLILHIPILLTNLKLTGSVLLWFMVTDFILSLINSFVFLSRRSLVSPILIHALYNLSIILYI